jgi:tRNA (Thr-GGU) A37 N-methylase
MMLSHAGIPSMIMLNPIGFVRSPRREVDDDGWGDVRARIELAEAFGPEALDGIEEFSHAEVLFAGRSGRALEVVGLDAVDGTPVLDIKPVMREFLPRTPVRQPAWATALMKSYWTGR